MNDLTVRLAPQTGAQHDLHGSTGIFRKGLRGEPAEPGVFLWLHDGRLSLIFPDHEAHVIIGAAIASGDPVAQVDKFHVGGVHCNAQFLQTPGPRPDGRFRFRPHGRCRQSPSSRPYSQCSAAGAAAPPARWPPPAAKWEIQRNRNGNAQVLSYNGLLIECPPAPRRCRGRWRCPV